MPNSLLSQIFTRKMLICVFTGFSSGLPLFVLLQMLPVWLTDKQLSVELIGAVTGVMLPYGLKFLWAPLLDRYFPSFLGRRRRWLLISQVILLVLLYAISLFDPISQLSIVANIALLIAFFSATQDIVLDAYRREILSDHELGLGNTLHINAYRIAGLIPGGLSLYLATIYPWETVFLWTALCMLAGIFMTLFIAKEPQQNVPKNNNHPFYQAFWIPLQEFFQRKGIAQAIGFLLFLFLYKFGDSFATTLQTKFIYDMGFSKKDIALVVKTTSLWAGVLSGLVGGIIMLKLGINRALWLFGFVQMITISGFIWLANFGHFDYITSAELWKLGVVIAAEYVGVGLGTAAFVAFMARETNPLYTATQLALFTSLSALPSKGLGMLSGYAVSAVGYYHYFWICLFLAIPGMICLFWVAPWNAKQ
ncbi:MFS transporter [Rodentibacter caecimuris]|uniref:AmpG family muropeptide MFS transporter n=1 Tax=Rodentibacter caecimuris TaxID=1796644 RepID=A0AAJ3K646_9PAST|nr:AmpG family muropeptide MFS transporter [Rodentibacter heylii]OOF77716.1 AmpG family muropeptide MFS transporter [Rodentibacter heylii]